MNGVDVLFENGIVYEMFWTNWTCWLWMSGIYGIYVCTYSWIVFAVVEFTHLFELKKWSFIYVKEGGCLITVMIVYEGGEGVLKWEKEGGMERVCVLRRSGEDGGNGYGDEVERGKKILLVFAMGFRYIILLY